MQVVVFSGSQREKMEEVFGGLNIWLAAENGVFLQPPGASVSGRARSVQHAQRGPACNLGHRPGWWRREGLNEGLKRSLPSLPSLPSPPLPYLLAAGSCLAAALVWLCVSLGVPGWCCTAQLHEQAMPTPSLLSTPAPANPQPSPPHLGHPFIPHPHPPTQ